MLFIYLLVDWNSPSTKANSLQQPKTIHPDLLVVGAGISGLSTALEAAQKGAQVTVVDLWSVFGGHGVVSGGVLSIVNTPSQILEGIKDSPELAYQDFIKWGEDANSGWVQLYVNQSKELIYDWVTPMGVTFSSLWRAPGNSVPRVHRTSGEGLALVSAIYKECLRQPNIKFIWNHKVIGLITSSTRVTGVHALNIRNNKKVDLQASAIILATGGFQSNLQMIRQFWPDHLQFPEKFLISAGLNALGSGHALAQNVGGAIHKMDHQWNYSTGTPDPRHPGNNRGFFAHSSTAIWVNLEGKRFTNESGSSKMTFPAVVNQNSSRFWTIFDKFGRKDLEIRGTSSDDPEEMISKLSPDLFKHADSIEQLAIETNLDINELKTTINRFNNFVENGEDKDFKRFEKNATAAQKIPLRPYTPQKIESSPFYALLTFPITRKSMGGVAIDLSCRVLDQHKNPISGLYAVGELTGFGGINGKAGLEGTFLGPSIVTGRIAARTVLKDLNFQTPRSSFQKKPVNLILKSSQKTKNNQTCLRCHSLPNLLTSNRPGYDHFKLVHQLVLKRQQQCSTCHLEFFPVRMDFHQINPSIQLQNCTLCH